MRRLTGKAVVVAMAAASFATVVGAPAAHALPPVERYLQVVAHQDDDLYFMNPDLDEAIAQNAATVTVFMTAGQGSGGPLNNTNTPQQNARLRQRGAQNAYATMAGVADGNDATQAEWTGAAWSVGGKLVERYTLTARPTIQLVFMDLSDGNLGNLFAGTPHSTIVPANQTLVTASQTYTKADAAGVLNAIMSFYQPTVLRAQDPEPDRRAGYTPDHVDHVAAASFARDAAAAYTGPLYEVNYRDYNVGDVPINLDNAAQTRKRAILTKYASNGYDGAVLQGINTAGNGNDNWSRRTYPRWSRGTQWAGRNVDGRAQAFVVRSGQVVTYAQTLAGAWTGPTALPLSTGRLTPGIAVGKNPDGRLELFAHRLPDHHIVALRQDAANGGFTGAWQDLGSPNLGWANFDNVGTPAVAARGDGQLQVFVKNGGGGLSHTYRTGINTWSGTWVDQGGTDLQDGLTAVTNPGGAIEVFGSTRAKILHWYQSTPNGAFIANTTFPVGIPASPPSAALSQGGAIDLIYRQPGTAHLMVAWQLAPASGWDTSPDDIGGPGGTGQPCMLLAPPGTDARIMQFARNSVTGVSTNRQVAANMGYGAWTNLSGGILDQPAAAIGVQDRVVVFTVGSDGVYVSSQATAGGGVPFGAWSLLGM